MAPFVTFWNLYSDFAIIRREPNCFSISISFWNVQQNMYFYHNYEISSYPRLMLFDAPSLWQVLQKNQRNIKKNNRNEWITCIRTMTITTYTRFNPDFGKVDEIKPTYLIDVTQNEK